MSTMPSTPQSGVPVFQLLQWKYAIKLESRGLKHSRGSVTAFARRKLGLAERTPRHLIIDHINSLLGLAEEAGSNGNRHSG